MRKKTAGLAAVFLLSAVWTAGCANSAGKNWDASENSIYVKKNLSVESAMVYTSEKENDLYSEEGLAEFAKEQISAFNEEQGALPQAENKGGSEKLPVALEKCSLKGQTGTLVFSYAAPEDFVKFSEETRDDTHTVTSLKVSEVEEAGLPDLSYQTITGKQVDPATAASTKGSHMVITEGSAKVYMEGKILYVSDGVELKSSYSAVTPEGTSCIIFK